MSKCCCKSEKWTTDKIADQSGRTIIITGSSSGLGKETTRVLAGKNATVIIAVRNLTKGEAARTDILAQFPNALIEVRELDLSSLKSIKAFADGVVADHDRLDVLINNAGVMVPPYGKTEDGFETQMGTNHLGHFALTGHLMPLLQKTENSRIVILSSLAHKGGKIDLSDLHWEQRKYKKWQAYGDSKIANLHFAYELARKLDGIDNAPMVVAAHPGWTHTDLQRSTGLVRALNPVFSQKVDMGALPTLRAGFDVDAQSGEFYGPKGCMEMTGYPVKVKSNKLSRDSAIAKALWDKSIELTGVVY